MGAPQHSIELTDIDARRDEKGLQDEREEFWLGPALPEEPPQRGGADELDHCADGSLFHLHIS